MNQKKQKIVAIIPARGGSKGVPGKNIKFLGGKPLIAYTIEAAKRCSLIDRVIVSTDDNEIAEVAKRYGAEVPFKRPKELAGDMVPTEPVLTHAVEWLEKNESYKTDIVVFLQSTDIPRTKGLIEKVIKRLLDDDSLDSVFVGTETRKNYWREKDGNWQRLASDIPPYGPRQLKPSLYREDTGLACATRVKFIKQGRRVGDKIDIIVNSSEFSIDINEPIDFWLAEKYWEKGIDLQKYEP
jgi:CMP-N,N'-diacetyllegionaminic acid synthase